MNIQLAYTKRTAMIVSLNFWAVCSAILYLTDCAVYLILRATELLAPKHSKQSFKTLGTTVFTLGLKGSESLLKERVEEVRILPSNLLKPTTLFWEHCGIQCLGIQRPDQSADWSTDSLEKTALGMLGWFRPQLSRLALSPAYLAVGEHSEWSLWVRWTLQLPEIPPAFLMQIHKMQGQLSFLWYNPKAA